MREFVYFSRNAWTSGNFDDLMQAGRLDIACHAVIHSFFVSEAERRNVRLHLFFTGPPDPPKHLELRSGEQSEEAAISKKDVAGLLKRMLYRSGDERIEAFPGCWVDRQTILGFAEEKKKEGRNIYLLDERGDNVRDVDIGEDPIFLLADQEGFPKAKRRRLKRSVTPVSLGDVTYFASQAITIVQNELDYRKIY